ncbi:phage recombination protein Bet [Limosilactobacillus equigenerosi]|uniref:Phage recombination protein Bet n=1 Tax=Limosilactobacillus equigenerosi DSM 18793 = JCM 14505 TaxID=1423742 RepID=A0A0R1UUW4_9LACO|nr:phage recombination protein Bet [Limosilactobacillus equigenerosi]KRL95192.1 phage recombination protein Bet [Limosilactobacillus equigenerosi DSM 18793 = JCM 14505]
MTMNQLQQSFENKEVIFQAGGEEVKLTAGTVKNYLVSGNESVTDQEVAMFINLCKYQHLNPFLNEAYLIKFKGRPAQIITSKEAFMKRAESNPHYRGSKAGVIVLRNNEIVYTNGAFTLPSDQIVGGWAEVKRDDRDEPVHVEISISEFGKGQATWKAMPANMIRKTALVNALREAFPDSLGSLYTEDDKHDFSQPRQVDADVQETPTKATESTAELLADFKASKEQQAKEQPKPVEPVEEDSDQMGLFEATGDVD